MGEPDDGGRLGMRAFAVAAVALLAAGALAGLVRSRVARQRAVPPSTRAYLAVRGLLARRLGRLPASVPPAEVARLFSQAVPDAEEDARAVVALYCETAFGGREAHREAEADLRARVRRLRKLA